MVIIIDGYNLLKFIYKKNYIEEYELNQFFSDLSNYVKRKKHYIILVLDAGPNYKSQVETKDWGKLVYSGKLQKADDYIMNYIELEANSKNSIIITADREISNFSSKHNIISIKPKLFYEKLKSNYSYQDKPLYSVKSVSGKAIKFDKNQTGQYSGELNNFNDLTEQNELDQLMQMGSQMLYYKDEEIYNSNLKQKNLNKNQNKKHDESKAVLNILKLL